MATEEGLGGSLEGMDLMDLGPWDGDYNDFLADLLPEDDGARGDAAVPSSSQDASGSAGGGCGTPLKHQGHPGGGCDGGSLLDPGALFGPGPGPGPDSFPGSPTQQLDVPGAASLKEHPASSTHNTSIASSGTSSPFGRGSPQASSHQQQEQVAIHPQQQQPEVGQCALAQQRHQSLPNQQHLPPHQRSTPIQAGKGESSSSRHELSVQPVQQLMQQQPQPPPQTAAGDDPQHRRSVSYRTASAPYTHDVAGNSVSVPLPLINSFSGELNGKVPVMTLI